MAPKHKSSEMPMAEPDAPEVGTAFSDLRFRFGDDSASWEKIRKAAAAQLDRMLRLVPKILRSDEPRHIHDFCVATRRFSTSIRFTWPAAAIFAGCTASAENQAGPARLL